MISPKEIRYIEHKVHHPIARHSNLASRPIGQLIHVFLNRQRVTKTAMSYCYRLIMFLEFMERELAPTLPEEIASLWLPFSSAQACAKHKDLLSYKPPVAILELVTDQLLDNFVHLQRQRGDRDGAIKSRISVVRRLLQFAFDSGATTSLLHYVFSSRVENPKAVRKGRILTIDEIQQLRDTVDISTTQGKRDLAMLDCMLLVGMSPTEIARLKMGDFFFKDNNLCIKPPVESLRDEFISVPFALHQSLLNWFYEAGLSWSLKESPAFFPITRMNIKERPISANAVSRLVTMYGVKADLAPGFGPDKLSHLILRMTAVRQAYDKGVPLEMVHLVAGVTPRMIDAYLGIEFNEIDIAPDIPDTWS